MRAIEVSGEGSIDTGMPSFQNLYGIILKKVGLRLRTTTIGSIVSATGSRVSMIIDMQVNFYAWMDLGAMGAQPPSFVNQKGE